MVPVANASEGKGYLCGVTLCDREPHRRVGCVCGQRLRWAGQLKVEQRRQNRASVDLTYPTDHRSFFLVTRPLPSEAGIKRPALSFLKDPSALIW